MKKSVIMISLKNFINRGPAIILFLLWIVLPLQFAGATETVSDTILIIDDIICRDNDQTRCDFITNKYYQNVGDVLDPDKVLDATLRLGALNQFEDVYFSLEKGQKRDHVVVVINVTEAPQLQTEISVGTIWGRLEDKNCEECKTLKFTNLRDYFDSQIIDYNFLGRGKIFEVNISGMQEQNTYPLNPDTLLTLALRFTDPYLITGRKYYFSSGISYFRDDNFGGSYSSYREDFNYTHYIENYYVLDLEFGRYFARYSNVGIRGEISYHQSECDTEYIDEKWEEVEYGANISYGWNYIDDHVFPTSGSAFLINVGYYGKPVDHLLIAFHKHWSFYEKNVLSLRLGCLSFDEFKIENYRNYLQDGVRYTRFFNKFREVGHKSFIKKSAWYFEHGLHGIGYSNIDGYMIKTNFGTGLTIELDATIIRFNFRWLIDDLL